MYLAIAIYKSRLPLITRDCLRQLTIATYNSRSFNYTSWSWFIPLDHALEDGYVLQQVSVCIFSTAIGTTWYGGCYPELLCCDFSNHSFLFLLRHLKRILKKRGLRRRNIQSNVETVIDVVEHELQWSGSTIGYRQMHQWMWSDHGVVIDQEKIRHIIKGLDPEGVEMRLKRRFRRRRYVASGPNFIWHLDGYDKL